MNSSTVKTAELLFGAGYGNRTRLHGLGSRCITDIRTLRFVFHIIADRVVNFNTFLSTESGKTRRLDKKNSVFQQFYPFGNK